MTGTAGLVSGVTRTKTTGTCGTGAGLTWCGTSDTTRGRVGLGRVGSAHQGVCLQAHEHRPGVVERAAGLYAVDRKPLEVVVFGALPQDVDDLVICRSGVDAVDDWERELALGEVLGKGLVRLVVL